MVLQARAEVHSALLAHAGKAREQAQHQPRPARVRFSVNTVGVGETRMTGVKSLDFGALMLEQPSFSWGVVSRDPLQAGQLPLCTAIILGYKQNANGAYIGADIAFKVECAKADVHLQFSLTFEASTLRSTVGNGTSTSASTGTNKYSGGDPAVVNVGDL